MDIKSICLIGFSNKTSNWEGWSEQILARNKRKGYKKLLQEREKVLIQSEFEKVVTAGDKKVQKDADLNEEAYGDIVLNTTHTLRQGEVAFSLLRHYKTRRSNLLIVNWMMLKNIQMSG